MKNYYHILGLTLESNPSDELITSCYKALAKIFHPDVFKGDKKLGKQKIRDINEAYEVLKDKKKKKKYDEELKAFVNQEKTTDEDVQRQESEYENYDNFNYDNFNANEFEKDWEIVLDVYPEIEEMRVYLAKVNIQLSFLFQVILINTKTYDEAKKIKDILFNNFLTINFGQNQLIRRLAEKMFANDHFDMATELSRYVIIIGDKDAKKLLDAFFKKYPFAMAIYGKDKKLKQETNKGCLYRFWTMILYIGLFIFVFVFLIAIFS